MNGRGYGRSFIGGLIGLAIVGIGWLAGCGSMPVEVVEQGPPAGEPVPQCVQDSDCDDGIFCNGSETCAAQECLPGIFPCLGLICQEVGTLCLVPEAPELCPDDPEKLSPGICGCGVVETDTDRDDTPDCLDGCPFDRNKIDPGDCGCRVRETDTDGDDTPDCLDHCPNDPQKIEPGLCGCGNVENGIDANADGVPDCIDQCPLDPNKMVPGFCGCGTDDLDLDRDGLPDLCLDNCGSTFNPDQMDSDFDGIGDACDSSPALTNFDAIMTACPLVERETILETVEITSRGRQLGATFGEQIDLLNEIECGQNPPCRECWLAVLEWVYFGLVP